MLFNNLILKGGDKNVFACGNKRSCEKKRCFVYIAKSVFGQNRKHSNAMWRKIC